MKRLINFILMLALVGCFAAGGMLLRMNTGAAAEKSSIGFVDSDLVLQNYKPTVAATSKLDALKEARERDLRQTMIEKFGTDDLAAISGENRSRADTLIGEAGKKFDAEVDLIREREWTPAVEKIHRSIEKVSLKKGLSIVLSSEAVLYGGVDITQDVMEELLKE
ncbi:MAG: OmpH family outer membrane protein [bacterium]